MRAEVGKVGQQRLAADLAGARQPGVRLCLGGTLEDLGAQVVVAVKERAVNLGVSRSWLYTQPDLRAEIERLRAACERAPASPPIRARQRASDASLRRRLQAVNAEIHRLRQQNQQLREQLAWALGERRAAAVRGQAEPTSTAKDSRPMTIGPCS